MSNKLPHFLLLTETHCDPHDRAAGGRWRFVLDSMSTDQRTEVSEVEPDVWGERLELLSVVRGVEALEQPSKLTLISSSAYVSKRIRHGFDSWIQNEWRWENFGLLKAVKDVDLWKRVHAATKIHSIECRLWQFSNRHRMNEQETAERWNRIDSAHSQVRMPYGPAEFESVRSDSATATGAQCDPNYSDRNFVATRTGWTRVTEIDPDSNRQLLFPQAFGGSVS